MQIDFEYITFKNLMSYGNSETRIDFATHKYTFVSAKNGGGKSAAFLDSICYVLYGKPYRDIKLGQLVNSINKKNLLVTISFRIGATHYLVKRGQKPSVFEIYKDNELILEEAASRDYQAMLEDDILGINLKTFKQIIVIGKAAYKPFMDLTAAERRSVTEDVLDISVFSKMQELAKTRVSELKSTIDSLNTQIDIIKNQIESHKLLVETLSNEKENAEKENAELRARTQQVIFELERDINIADAVLTENEESLGKYDHLSSNTKKLENHISKLRDKMSRLHEELEFFNQDSCPTCHQLISKDLKQEKHEHHSNETSNLAKELSTGTELLSEFSNKLIILQESINRHKEAKDKKANLTWQLNKERQSLESLNTSTHHESLDLVKQKLKDSVETLITLTNQKNNDSKQIEYYRTCVELLKDSGIKSKVIASFIPIMNTLLNEYLQRFDMFVSFELDEMFRETIKSRNRDEFSYNSFSEGEKAKIDLSILFAWRKIAMSRNSISTNLIIFDETLDQSMDAESVDSFVDILSGIEDNVNPIVISHRAIVPEMFDRHITIEKRNDFSIIMQND